MARRGRAPSTSLALSGRLSRPVLFALPPPGAKNVRAWLKQQHADLDDEEGLEKLGAEFLDLVLANARVAPSLGTARPVRRLRLNALPDQGPAGLASRLRRGDGPGDRTPTDLAGMLSLSAVAAAVAKKVVVEVRDGYREPVNLFTVVAQPPASRKSAVFRAVAAPIEEFDRERAELAKPLVAEARSKRAVAEKKLDELERKASKATGADQCTLTEAAANLATQLATTKVPQVPRLLADDATPERLTGLMAANKGRIAVLSPEGELFDMAAGRYSSGK